MAGEPGRLQTSAEIAAHSGTNAVVVRRVLGRLREAGLLVSEKGHHGGWQLARSPQAITLADVYLALDEQLVTTENETDTPDCSIEHALQKRISSVMADIEHSLLERLAATTIAEVCDPENQ